MAIRIKVRVVVRIIAPLGSVFRVPHKLPRERAGRFARARLALESRPRMKGFLAHLWLTLKLNFRNPQAVVFGYVVPVFFLLAFVAFFGQGKKDPLSHSTSTE